jgi:hypothetical protein
MGDMTNVDGIVAWLLAQHDEDERVARGAMPGPWRLDEHAHGREVIAPPIGGTYLTRTVANGVMYGDMHESLESGNAEHIARHDPSRVLREVAAMRRRLARHAPVTSGGHASCRRCATRSAHGEGWPCPDIIDDAQAYADRDGFPHALRFPTY